MWAAVPPVDQRALGLAVKSLEAPLARGLKEASSCRSYAIAARSIGLPRPIPGSDRERKC